MANLFQGNQIASAMLNFATTVGGSENLDGFPEHGREKVQ
jgi:hypothetical protein